MLKLQLLTTEYCHLCEAVLDLMLNTPELAGLPLEVVDIATNDGLLERYAEQIPVVRALTVPSSGGHGEAEQLLAELPAPIDREALLAFLDRLPAPTP